jgi:hypothetical protein
MTIDCFQNAYPGPSPQNLMSGGNFRTFRSVVRVPVGIANFSVEILKHLRTHRIQARAQPRLTLGGAEGSSCFAGAAIAIRGQWVPAPSPPATARVRLLSRCGLDWGGLLGDPRTGAKNCSIRNSFQFEVSMVLPVA